MTDFQALQEAFDYNRETGVIVRKSNGKPFGSVNNKGYLVGKVAGFTISAHRLAFALVAMRWPVGVDHVNRVKTDNRWSNLREATVAENQANVTPSKGGVRVERSGRYTARFRGAHLGTFDTRKQAEAAYKQAQDEAISLAFGHGLADKDAVRVSQSCH